MGYLNNLLHFIYIFLQALNDAAPGWVLSRYDEKSLSEKTLKVTEVTSKEGGLFGISEDDSGNIWFGGGDGVYRYDGNTITDFKSNERLK